MTGWAPRMYTAKQVAAKFGTSVGSVRRWHAEGRLVASYRLPSGRKRWDADLVDELAARPGDVAGEVER